MSIKPLINSPNFTMPCVDIADSEQIRVAITSTSATATTNIAGAYYDVWSDVDVYVKVSRASASTVTATTGYLLRAGNTVPFGIRDGYQIGAIAASANGTLVLHKSWNADI